MRRWQPQRLEFCPDGCVRAWLCAQQAQEMLFFLFSTKGCGRGWVTVMALLWSLLGRNRCAGKSMSLSSPLLSFLPSFTPSSGKHTQHE